MTSPSQPSSPAAQPPEAAPRTSPAVFLRGVAGAVVGGLLGYLLFRWLLSYGYYALIVPGALLGLGAGLAARGSSLALGAFCAVAALGLGIYSRWVVDAQPGDLVSFLGRLHTLSPPTLLMLAVGSLCGWWFGRGR